MDNDFLYLPKQDIWHPYTYIAIDMKSFYASVECVKRHLDPLRAHLLVADESRTDHTICLAVSPALKALGVLPDRGFLKPDRRSGATSRRIIRGSNTSSHCRTWQNTKRYLPGSIRSISASRHRRIFMCTASMSALSTAHSIFISIRRRRKETDSLPRTSWRFP